MNKPFEGDTYIKDEIIVLKNKFGLKYCVETGTQYGSTTLELHDKFDCIVTIEGDQWYYNEAMKRFKDITTGASRQNIRAIKGMSQDVLRMLPLPDNIFYYLDAHGCEIGGCPLKKELEVIATKNHTNVCIAIHDFKVPGKDFGYDTYDFELCYEEIEPYLKMIYPNGFDYHYNDLADGATRGIIYIYPKKIKHANTY
jgi:hypothetical protein